jgi:drug/metabolite transporter (DMT)-like permease
MNQPHTPWRAVIGAMMVLVGLGYLFSADTASRIVGVLLVVTGCVLGSLGLVLRNRAGR